MESLKEHLSSDIYDKYGEAYVKQETPPAADAPPATTAEGESAPAEQASEQPMPVEEPPAQEESIAQEESPKESSPEVLTTDDPWEDSPTVELKCYVKSNNSILELL